MICAVRISARCENVVFYFRCHVFAFLLLQDDRDARRNCPLIRSRVIFRLVLGSDEKVNVLFLEGHDTVELSAQRYRGDPVLFPIIGVLGIADFGASLLVERVSEYRLEVLERHPHQERDRIDDFLGNVLFACRLLYGGLSPSHGAHFYNERDDSGQRPDSH
jgi:hypothetical protein